MSALFRKARQTVKSEITEVKLTRVQTRIEARPNKRHATGSGVAAGSKQKAVHKPAPGSKPTGVAKRPTQTKPRKPTAAATAIAARGKGEPSLDDALAEARRWLVSPTSYIIRNTETGCFGLSSRKPAEEGGGRSEITVAHTEDCECLDARLAYVCRHVDGLLRSKRIRRRSRDALVIAIKIRLPAVRRLLLQLPEDTRFPTAGEEADRKVVRPREEVEAEDKIVNVVDRHNHQRLVEKWKSLQAYRARPIWKDW